ncbi:DMT family transporter [Lysinibacillus piscis]|uniref:Membrane protein n=1 Tax=Lysinibacillus piscis TaxID=2518931 RepID=A0ABQ5NJD6_9BACI|nr:DMT family transporter [Lysinibacillus sp. KH24]GLC88176.1 membrane protein [Lysinibacillus sp. KH24]
MKQVTTYLILVACVFFWASNFIIGAILVEHWSPVMVAILRLIVIVLFLGCISWRAIVKVRLTKRDVLLLTIAGILGVAINHYSFYASLQHTSPITAALILACAPIVTSLLNKVIYKEKRNWLFWLGAVTSFIGVALIITKGAWMILTIGKGEILSLITMVSFALFLIMVNHLSVHLSAAVITFYTNGIGLIVLLPFSINHWSLQATAMSYWLLLISSAIFIHGISNLLWNKNMKVIGSTNASLLLNIEPAIAMALSALILRNYPTMIQIGGSILILLGIVLCIYQQKVNKKY